MSETRVTSRLRIVTGAVLILFLAGGLSGCGCGGGSSGASGGEDIDIVVGASAAGGGELRALFDETTPVGVSPTASLGTVILYGSTNPGFFAAEQDDPQEGLFALASGTTISVEIVRIDAGAAVKFADTILDAAGESYSLGTAPRIHFHPEWQLALAMGDEADRTVTLKLATTSPIYAESPPFTVTLTVARENAAHDANRRQAHGSAANPCE